MSYRLQQILPSLTRFDDIEATIVLMPLVSKHAKRNANPYGSYESPANLEAREQRPEKPLAKSSTSSALASATSKATAPTSAPKTTIPACYLTEKACNNATASCMGHGSCVLKYSEREGDEKIGADCWACACSPTVIETTNKDTGKKSIKTTYWGGPACQKKDVSSPFLLFAGIGIFLAAAIAWGVGMMYSIGDQQLPSVLGAGVAPPPRK